MNSITILEQYINSNNLKPLELISITADIKLLKSYNVYNEKLCKHCRHYDNEFCQSRDTNYYMISSEFTCEHFKYKH